MISRRLRDYALLLRLDKPIGIWLLLWPTLWALWFASRGTPPPDLLAVFVLGTILMRSAGCVINDYADRNFDPHVERTKNRPIAAGRVSPREALVLFALLCLLALLVALRLDAAALWLSLPAVLLAASYPLAKRFHSLPQAHLGIAFSWGIPMAYAAVRGSVPWLEAGQLMAANLCWVIAYDTWYAMSDREDDLKVGVKSSAILFGRYDRLIIGLLQALALALLWSIGRLAARGPVYDLGLAAAAGFALYQQYLGRKRERGACFAAFLNNNGFGAAILIGLVCDCLLWSGHAAAAGAAAG
jgi:4-hydroxybenzoate polyprenyltransferase